MTRLLLVTLTIGLFTAGAAERAADEMLLRASGDLAAIRTAISERVATMKNSNQPADTTTIRAYTKAANAVNRFLHTLYDANVRELPTALAEADTAVSECHAALFAGRSRSLALAVLRPLVELMIAVLTRPHRTRGLEPVLQSQQWVSWEEL